MNSNPLMRYVPLFASLTDFVKRIPKFSWTFLLSYRLFEGLCLKVGIYYQRELSK